MPHRIDLSRFLVARPTADSASYRADIDGLRGIAVLAVVLYHAFPGVVRSGFVGVDVFFVISGYLITGILLGDLRKGRFTFRHFYARRIRRIFPALLVVLAFTFAFGAVYLFGSEFRRLGKHVAGASAFVSNFVLWAESGYFDTAAETKPLLHLWSLGIEEQFYLVWPLLVWLTWRERSFRLFILAIVAVSFLYNLHQIRGSSPAAFFPPLPRIWELGVGSVLAAWPARRWSDRAGEVAAAIGLAAIGISMFAIVDSSRFPGWWAVLPVLGTASLIATGPALSVHRFILRVRPLVWLGLISYPLYLWHWPLISFAAILGDHSAATRGALAAVSVFLAWATWSLVERPIRFGPEFSRAKIVGLSACMALVGSLGFLALRGAIHPVSEHGLSDYVNDLEWTHPDRFKPVPFETGDFDRAADLRRLLDRYSGPDGTIQFHWLASASRRKALYVGDSHMEHYWPRIEQLILERPEETRSAVFLTASRWLPITRALSDPRRDPEFVGLAAAMMSYALSDPAIDTVVFSSLWGWHLCDANSATGESTYYAIVDGRQEHLKRGRRANEAVLADLEKMIRTLEDAGKRVFILQSVTGGSIQVRRNGTAFTLVAPPVLAKDFLREHGPLRERLFRLGREAGAEVIDPYAWMCKEGICPTLYDGNHPVYKDGAHLADRFARLHATFIDRTLLLESVDTRKPAAPSAD